jgi:ATP-binding cassette subfamily F protein uup
MNYISAESLSKSIADKALFKNINLGISKGDRIGLIGINGSGKSTLLKILAGLDLPDSGVVAVAKGIKIGFLGQNPVFDEDKTVYDNVFNSGNRLLSLIKQYEIQVNKIHDGSAEYDDKLQDLTERMTLENAWTYEQQIKEIISRLGIGEYLERPVRVLSGGQRKRVAMAKVLIDEPDLLIMDEPTNHLDLETIEWLEETINNRFQTVLLVTHDRYFLDSVANHIIELDRAEIFKYKGNYGYFLEKKAEREESKNTEIDKAKNLMRRELDWIRKQPKARGTKAKYRVDAFEETKEKATQKTTSDKLELQIKTTRQGGKILEIKKIAKSFDTLKLIEDFSYTFKKGDKIGIIGKNGMGKTTFLNMLLGILPPDKGDIVKGDTTLFGYYKQEEPNLANDKRLIEVVKEIAEYIEMADGSKISASQFLTKFMFPPADQYKFISKLSGGERKRVQLLQILIKNPNFLILDEPTNDLDIGTLNVLEEFLEDFNGSLIIVSHDRYFMDKLVEHLFVFEGNGVIKDFPGNYTDYRAELQNSKQQNQEKRTENIIQETEKKPQNQSLNSIIKKKLSYKEQKEYDDLEVEISKLEKKKNDLTIELNSGGQDHVKLNQISIEIQEINAQLDIKSMRWLELSDY